MKPVLKTPEQVAERLFPVNILYCGTRAGDGAAAIRADREQVAAWCEDLATKAQREAKTHEDAMKRTGIDEGAARQRFDYCEGQAAMARTIAAMLRGCVSARDTGVERP